MNNRSTETQRVQAEQILGSGLFSGTERRQWLLDLAGMTVFEARWAITVLSETYKARKRQQEAA
jgi:hypothetical protein